jgi:hypothetical protein
MSLKVKKCCTGYFVSLFLPSMYQKKEGSLWRCLCLIQRMGQRLNQVLC